MHYVIEYQWEAWHFIATVQALSYLFWNVPWFGKWSENKIDDNSPHTSFVLLIICVVYYIQVKGNTAFCCKLWRYGFEALHGEVPMVWGNTLRVSTCCWVDYALLRNSRWLPTTKCIRLCNEKTHNKINAFVLFITSVQWHSCWLWLCRNISMCL